MNITTIKTRKKPFRLACLGAVLALFSISAHATIIDNTTNNPLNFNWSSTGGGYSLTGTGSLTVTGFSSSQLTVAVTLTNTTVAVDPVKARLAVFGFGISPDATGVTFSDALDGGMTGAALGDIPSIKTIEVCAFGQNCSSGANDGILANGGSDTFSLLLAGAWGTSVDIAPIGFKYQTNNGSFEFTTTSTSSGLPSTGGQQTAPEPSSLTLLGLGLIASVFALRRRALQA